MYGPKRDEVTGGWRNMRNEDLHSFFSLPNIKKNQVMNGGMGRACSVMGARGERRRRIKMRIGYFWENYKKETIGKTKE
jgi:hypothetical protein